MGVHKINGDDGVDDWFVYRWNWADKEKNSYEKQI